MTLQRDQEQNIPPASGHLIHPRYRPDIDGLRAVAVLSVVAFHAFPSEIGGGFVGVDIFFVISGFLIATIIFSSLERDEFRFSEFYSRRIRRIFPALLAVLIACYAFGWFALTAGEYQQLGKHIAAGAGFVSNLVLWNESGYFDAAAETKPLLHLWSLGIEEQFYIFWPLLLWAAWKRRFNLLAITAGVALISFLLNLTKYRSDGVADFYSPQTRFWELLAGSLLAYMTQHANHLRHKVWPGLPFEKLVYSKAVTNRSVDLRDVQSVLGAVLIAAGVIFINKASNFPGTWALLPVIGAVMVISAGKSAWLNRVILSNRVLVWIGLISFPLYLWHWPLLSFARVIESETPSRSIRIAAVLISLILAWITYSVIERPLRFGKKNRVKVIFLAVSMLVAGYVGYTTLERNGLPFRSGVQEFEAALSFMKWRDEDNSDAICQKRFEHKYSYCKLTNDAAPTIALIGDSFANSYFQGLSEEYKRTGDNLVMLGAPGCPPLLDITSGFAGQRDWCNSMSSNAIREVAAIPSVRTIILAANWHLYINGARFHQHNERPWEIKAKDAEGKTNDQVFFEKMKLTIEFIGKSGKKLIVMKQTPEINIDPATCVATRPLAIHKKEKKCAVSAKMVKSYLSEYESVFDLALSNNADVAVLDPYSSICSEETCIVMDGAYPIYRDDLHLSLYGSKYMASRLKLF
ncbi:acyltransferase 3 [Methylocella silvestris BL2]|uniref:Acyltransferase 3 n=1 Tax=Methylocella silvestris (strain DSM 15510 / CIP 108128 / LMG 27833 / NCIMB 13906 / BL2) TaxID=395965 RepID=B8EMS4_METSB|nr:acyltransferase family protein [Methylocella silvestris]ACK52753.1 acyltransferase 3 [Methylocella silvestris BL2]